jgi:hypothetical protein
MTYEFLISSQGSGTTHANALDTNKVIGDRTMKQRTRKRQRSRRSHQLLAWEQALFGRYALLARRFGKPANHLVNAISGKVRPMEPILELFRSRGRIPAFASP